MLIGSLKNKYHYALIRYMPNVERGEGLNVGLVVRNDKEQLVYWDSNFIPHKAFKSMWNKSVMQEWEEFYKEEMTVLLSNNEEKLTESYWSSIRRRCQEQYILSDSMFLLNEAGTIRDVAQYLFEKLVVAKPSKPKNRVSYSWATDFFKKRRFFDKEVCKYPVQQKYEILWSGLQFCLPFYQKNGKHRAIWATNHQTSLDATLTRQGSKCISEATLLREHWGSNAEFIFIAKDYDKENPDIKAAKIAKVEVMPIDAEETRKYFEAACEYLGGVEV
jgi:hypothetical protein